jgi:hypothetical protein
MVDVISLIGMSVGFASMGIAIVIAHNQSKLRKIIEDGKNSEQDHNVLSVLSSYLNFVINLQYLRNHQKNVMILENDDPHKYLDIIKYNLKMDVNFVVKRSEEFIQLVKHNLKYFPKKSYQIITWTGTISENVRKLEEDNMSERALFQIEYAFTSCIEFLKEYEPLTNETKSGVQYCLDFYINHEKNVIRNIGKMTEKHIHCVYNSINGKYFI